MIFSPNTYFFILIFNLQKQHFKLTRQCVWYMIIISIKAILYLIVMLGIKHIIIIYLFRKVLSDIVLFYIIFRYLNLTYLQ